MNYKIHILGFASIVLVGVCAFLVSTSVNPAYTSSPNAKRESMPPTGFSKEAAMQSELKIAQQTLTYLNAKRE